ncbi:MULTISPECIES: DoxX family protein [Thioalkalivibrio]|uniref:GntR family transcriptional regulator n=1 Tax=Thioalkalivibrio halophilus TaxID=252474 RepID=A0A1V2ZV18_9GAMM|nr:MULTISPECIES: DoxX family protein [Thioalkalivibrio]OOC08990.1 GntR family transcriptional regulator [Thioalkalivibrio halophilus]PYG03798.1 putative oxidoreductase [Thioalkalivibrio sp. ALE21]
MDSMLDDTGKLVLRLALGVMILLHGVDKILGGISGIESMVVGAGLPAFVAWGVYIGEVLAPILVILGLYARIGAVLIAINMVFAIALAHAHELTDLTAHGGWVLELQGMFLFAAAALALTGPGHYSVNRS